MKKKGEGKTLCVDFDGVIHGYSKGWQDGTIYDNPVPGAKEGLEQLKNEGYKILIYSTRCNPDYLQPDDPDRVKEVREYLDKNSIPYDLIHIGGKPKAHIYIDDRAISFKGDWKQTVSDVIFFNTWNRPGAKSSSEIEAEQNKKKING